MWHTLGLHGQQAWTVRRVESVIETQCIKNGKYEGFRGVWRRRRRRRRKVSARKNVLFVLTVVQRDATQSSLFIILQVHSTCFGCQTHPSSSTQYCNYSLRYCAAASLQRSQARSPSLATLEGGSCTKIWPVPDAVVTVLCTPDDGCGWRPKHVEWTCRIINRLLYCNALDNY